MTIDAGLLRYHRAIAEGYPPMSPNADARTVRARFGDIAKAYSQARSDAVAAENVEIPLEGRTLAARVYKPKAAPGPLPLIVYFHGGGWVVGDLDTHDGLVERLAQDSQCAVASVDYRLAPEHPFPAPCDDAIDALIWFAEHRSRLGFATDRLAVGGDSAGAHLAVVAAREANQRVAGLVSAQLLLYPVMRRQFDSPSCIANANGPGLTSDELKWYWAQFLSGETPRDHDVRAFPLSEPFERTPAPAIIVAAAYDPLYDDAFELERFLGANGGRVEMIDARDMAHGFARVHSQSDAALGWLRRIGERTGELVRAVR
ncbi:esterase/lipase [Caballeronia catudaia]|uniref:Esterase/lipase n=1 Tax=Caballeronia catudaia TaxID=1777136 RepID=A0A157Z1D5_9BURK|nr:alpha/beta hydrolase [Caballeronia catudaia]SAK39331.1 esterase/lipase [Caballeronia catudaia]